MSHRRPQARRARRPLGLGAWATLAGLVHTAGLLVWLMRPHPRPETPPQRIVPLDDQAVARALERARAARPKSAPSTAPRPKPKPPKQPLGPVVDLAAPDKAVTPTDDARFLAEHATRAERETRSRHAEGISHRPMPVPSQARTQALGSSQPPDISAQPPEPRAEAPQPRATASSPSSSLRLPASADAQRPAPGPRVLQPQGPHEAAPARPAAPENAPHRTLSMADLIPGVGKLAGLTGAPSADVPRDVEIGEGTFLNAREFRYAGFFRRVKQQLAGVWHPQAEFARRDPTGTLYGEQPRETGLTITLDAQGALVDVVLAAPSGLDFLDQEGVRAVRAAAPFMHPPKGLRNEAQQIVFSFYFVVEPAGSRRYQLGF